MECYGFTETAFEHVKDHLQGVIEDVYKTGSIDDLEFHLDNIIYYFGLKLPLRRPLLTKREEKISILQEWQEFNKKYLKQVSGQ